MKNTMFTAVLTSVLVSVTLFVMNYFTGMGYRLPHKPITIDISSSNDVFIRAVPAFIAIPSGLSINDLVLRTTDNTSDNNSANISASDEQ